MIHKPVLTKEVLEYLNPRQGENFIDGTVGEAGHTMLLLEKNGPDGKVLAIDQDTEQLKNSKLQTEKFGQRIVLVAGSYVDIKSIAEKLDFKPVHGILLDLGMSSWQLENSKKGFSFQKDEVLDMRYDLQNTLTAQKIVNDYPEDAIFKILKEYGEELFAKKIAKNIIEQRRIKKIETTFELKEIIKNAIPQKFQHGKIHYATKTFQALRIAVNDELNNITKVLPEAVSLLASNGRLVVISFHSLEDRIVKNFFKDKNQEGVIKILTKKPITAGGQEIILNPRSRSAKLRALVKI